MKSSERIIELLCKLNAAMKSICMESYDSITVHPKVFYMIVSEISPFINRQDIQSDEIKLHHAGHSITIKKGKKIARCERY